MNSMFCFQCEQTAGGRGCTAVGVCGKKPDIANLQDKLTGSLIKLATLKGTQTLPAEVDSLMFECLFATLTNVNFDDQALERLISRINHAIAAISEEAAAKVKSTCDKCDITKVWEAEENIRSLKSLILFGMKGIAAYAHHCEVLGYSDPSIAEFCYRGLRAIGSSRDADELLGLAMEAGKTNLTCMQLLDKANTTLFGTPVPTTVPLNIEPGPFIVVTGHDLLDLKLLLQQTEGRGVNVYTHGEMLPSHAYPLLKAFPHLKGNYGTAWQNQQKEFANIPAPILFTTNCLMPPRPSYADRVCTTAVVGFPGAKHIGPDKDFSELIEQALALGGYDEPQELTGINGGHQVTTGFGHAAILQHAGTVVQAVKDGAISHFFLVGGCDGAKTGRNYYTEFVKQAPQDSIILTLACGKYRFNDLDLGKIGGLPRLMDMGQCNDAYGAIQVASALAQAFNCGINDLPLTLMLSWYEQKAVSILLTLLHLGVKNIYLGPSLPAFVSPGVLQLLVEKFNLTPISDPAADLAKILGK